MVQAPVREQQVVRGRLPSPRRDKRPALAALAVLLILLGALGSALVAFRSGDRVSVLESTRAIQVGEEVEASDFRVVKVAGDVDGMLSQGSLGNFVGSRAVVGVPQGTVVNAAMFRKGSILPDGAEEVGVSVTARQRPGNIPRPGDVVRLYYVTSDQGSAGQGRALNPGDSVVGSARVLDVSARSGADAIGLTVIVDRNDAGTVASLSTTNNLALTVLPADTKPEVDLVSSSDGQ